MAEFLFKPGDKVATAADIDVPLQMPTPNAFRVVERVTVECIGGVQRYYRLRAFTSRPQGTIVTGIVELLDFEVVAYPAAEEIAAREEQARKNRRPQWDR